MAGIAAIEFRARKFALLARVRACSGDREEGRGGRRDRRWKCNNRIFSVSTERENRDAGRRTPFGFSRPRVPPGVFAECGGTCKDVRAGGIRFRSPAGIADLFCAVPPARRTL